ncbi:MAG: flagellar hook-length control protein FliK [Planctomycetales bacterium]
METAADRAGHADNDGPDPTTTADTTTADTTTADTTPAAASPTMSPAPGDVADEASLTAPALGESGHVETPRGLHPFLDPLQHPAGDAATLARTADWEDGIAGAARSSSLAEVESAPHPAPPAGLLHALETRNAIRTGEFAGHAPQAPSAAVAPPPPFDFPSTKESIPPNRTLPTDVPAQAQATPSIDSQIAPSTDVLAATGGAANAPADADAAIMVGDESAPAMSEFATSSRESGGTPFPFADDAGDGDEQPSGGETSRGLAISRNPQFDGSHQHSTIPSMGLDHPAQQSAAQPTAAHARAGTSGSEAAGKISAVAAGLNATVPSAEILSPGAQVVAATSEDPRGAPTHDGSPIASGPSSARLGDASRADGPFSPVSRDGQQPRIDSGDFLNRLTAAWHSSRDGGRYLRIRLDPPELGSLQVEVIAREGVLSARLDVETRAAQRIVLEHLGQLREVLAQHGTAIDHIDVFLNARQSDIHSGEFAGRGFEGDQPHGERRDRPHQGGADQPEAEGPPRRIHPHTQVRLDRLDILV